MTVGEAIKFLQQQPEDDVLNIFIQGEKSGFVIEAGEYILADPLLIQQKDLGWEGMTTIEVGEIVGG